MSQPFRKPELLAPAGDLDALYAAFDAGADAVYLGVTDFNARMRAKNFTVKTLSYVVPRAHALGKKVYVTMNILVKQAELAGCITTLHQLDQIGVDAIIVQDLGIVDIAKRAFPRLALHASTQMAVHNSLGARAARDLGIRRVVLARELTLNEIETIGRKSGVELEVFVHGALCYCFSGMCLASSFLGGSSGNRGRCTQVCRRPFQTREGRRGHLFSPSDFCALPRLRKLMEMGVAGFKIEGRMKNEHYVYSVVSAYRKAIDDPSAVVDLSAIADSDLERKKSLFFLDGVSQDGIVDPLGPSGTGVMIGAIEKRDGASITVAGNHAVSKGDDVRIQPKSGFEGVTYRVVQSVSSDAGRVLALGGNVECRPGDLVYLVHRGKKDRRAGDRGAAEGKPVRYGQQFPRLDHFMNMYSSRMDDGRVPAKRSLTIVVDNPRWRECIDPAKVEGVVMALGRQEVRDHLLDGTLDGEWKKKMIVGLPHFIAEADIGFWKEAGRELAQRGIRRFLVQNLGQWSLVDPPAEIDGGGWLWCFNRAAQKAFYKIGIRRFTYSPEDDFPNMQRCASGQAFACLFAYVPLFISRIQPGLRAAERCRDAFGNEFLQYEKDDVYYLVAKKPLCLFQKRKKLEEEGIVSFVIDLSFCTPDRRLLEDLLHHYEQGTKVEGSGMFNFKLGIR